MDPDLSTLAPLLRLLRLPDEIASLREEVRALAHLLKTTSASQDLLNVEGVAKLLKMTPAAVRRATARGTIPSVRIGRRVRYRADEVLNARKR